MGLRCQTKGVVQFQVNVRPQEHLNFANKLHFVPGPFDPAVNPHSIREAFEILERVLPWFELAADCVDTRTQRNCAPRKAPYHPGPELELPLTCSDQSLRSLKRKSCFEKAEELRARVAFPVPSPPYASGNVA